MILRGRLVFLCTLAVTIRHVVGRMLSLSETKYRSILITLFHGTV
jgi:hypothetical protein